MPNASGVPTLQTIGGRNTFRDTSVKKKTTSMKSTRPALSPLLGGLTYSRTAREPMVNTMLLQCYAALDAFHPGHGSMALFITLCHHLLVAEELASSAAARSRTRTRRSAREPRQAPREGRGQWSFSADEYASLCDALSVARTHRAGGGAHGHAIAGGGQHAPQHGTHGNGIVGRLSSDDRVLFLRRLSYQCLRAYTYIQSDKLHAVILALRTREWRDAQGENEKDGQHPPSCR